MGANCEWNEGEASSVALPSMVSSSDLFDGELFGDELIDIYNNGVNEDTGDLNGIPVLEPSTAKISDVDEEHPGARVAVTAAAMDDGLGAFRPSTSFNDLATIMEEAKRAEDADVTAAEGSPELPISGKSTATTKNTGILNTNTKKRCATSSSDAPSSKRKAAVVRTRKTITNKQSSPTSNSKLSVPQDASAAATLVESSVVTPLESATGEEAAATAAAVEAAAAAAAASFTSLPDLSSKTADVTAEHTLGEETRMDEDVNLASGGSDSIENDPFTSGEGATSSQEDAGEESQFKSIAQQAVSSLIMNANNTRDPEQDKRSKYTSKNDKQTVNTSTAHIKALTGNNWVAACTGTASSVSSPTNTTAAASVTEAMVSSTTATSLSNTETNDASSGSEKNQNRIRRQNLSPDERARQNRDRNREHARNTRLRKKAYVEELKRTLTELVAQRDASELEKRQAAQRELEQREVRFRVIEEFLKLRGRNESNFARWAAILEDGFTLTVPSAPSLYSNTLGAEIIGFEQQLKTVELVMAESASFSGFLQTIRGDGGEGDGVTLSFYCDRKNFFMDGCQAVLEWTASVVGRKSEILFKGLTRGKFCPASNKLLTASMCFDTGAMASQVQMHQNTTEGTEVESSDDAQAAASQADAILDSLEINHVHLNVVSPSDISEKGAESSCDEHSTGEHATEEMNIKCNQNTKESKMEVEGSPGMTTRGVQRRH